MSGSHPDRREATGLEDAARIDVLLIDDNADFPVLIRRALESRDPRYRVTSVATPEDGELLLESRPFDLVLLDYKFPRGVNGLQVIRKLKNKATYIPTVMVTAFGDEGLAIQAMREGALDFVPKASDFIQALPDVVGRAIERGRIIRERIATQRALEHRNRELQALSDITSAINASVNQDEILSVARHRLGDLFSAVRATVHLVEKDSSRLVRVGERAALDPALDVRDGSSAIAWAVADGIVQVNRDERGDIEMVVPLVAGMKILGAITLFLGPHADPDPAEQALAASIGKQVGVALERARLQGALTTTQAYVQDLVEHAADEIITLDPAARIQSWNSGAESAYGWTAEDVVGKPWDLLWATERHGEAADLATAVLVDHATIRNHETMRRTKDGAPVAILLTLTPLRAPDGSIRGVSCMGKNVTLFNQLQGQLVQSEKMAVVGQLISGVAHELNNPLTSVLGYAQLMAEVDVGPKRDAYLNKITAEAGRCQRIVSNLLAFARKHEPKATPVDLNHVLRATMELRQYDLRTCDIELEADLADSLPATMADGHQLQQVFVNLITNAQQAMKGHGRGRIVLSSFLDASDAEHPAIIIRFCDNGPGVPSDIRSKIFDPFFTTKAVGEGTGLGLSLSYGIVKQHAGDIIVTESTMGGARFEIRLPVLAAVVRESSVPSETRLPVTSPVTSETKRLQREPTTTARRRILVVDDQEPVRELVSDALGPLGYDVVLAQDGREALEMITSNVPFDLVIADLRMPEYGGDRLWRQVRRFSPELADRMVFSSGDLTGDALRFLGGATNRCIPKPFGVEDVRSTVTEFFKEQP